MNRKMKFVSLIFILVLKIGFTGYVSVFATDIDKSTGILIDDKYLLIYRCDYTLYDTELLN